ncbi:alpha/beta hydrolase [Flavobacterium algicola]|uniref:alpha/beta hydrolase n=1 Tax=Flavobacterium algicola TaxID=556529 RepID=UPI001EFC3CE9|nr:alpha/beta hydrolase [Flavobacterium algicola]MCG9792306.1 alpha/beta hydrolase [Flavobacterium algicola]
MNSISVNYSRHKYNWIGFYTMLLFLVASNVFSQSATNTEDQEIIPDHKLVYKTIDAVALKLHVFNPLGHKSSDKTPVIIFFFGGGWVFGNPKLFYEHARYFAEKGIVAIAAEYRIKSIHKTTPFECVNDGKSAVRWVRLHATELGIDPNKIVASGGSAGGHVAACTSIIDGYNETNENGAISSKPNALILYYPVLDTTDKGYGAKNFEKEHQTDISPNHNIKKGILPTIVFHGTADKTVPIENSERFCKLMNDAGNYCELETYKEKGHGFFRGSFYNTKKADTIVFKEILEKSYSFLVSQSIITNNKK